MKLRRYDCRFQSCWETGFHSYLCILLNSMSISMNIFIEVLQAPATKKSQSMPLLIYSYATPMPCSKIQMFWWFKIIQKSILSAILCQSNKTVFRLLKIVIFEFKKMSSQDFLNIWLSFKMYSMYNIQITNYIHRLSCPSSALRMTNHFRYGTMALKSARPLPANENTLIFPENWIIFSRKKRSSSFSNRKPNRNVSISGRINFRLLTLMFNLNPTIIRGIIKLNQQF